MPPCAESGRADRLEYLEPIVLAGDEGSVRVIWVVVICSGDTEYGDSSWVVWILTGWLGCI